MAIESFFLSVRTCVAVLWEGLTFPSMGRFLPTSHQSSRFSSPHSCHSLPFFPPRSDPDLQINQTPNIPSSHHYRSFFDPPKPTTVPECLETQHGKQFSIGRVSRTYALPPRNKQKRRSRSRWFEKPQSQTGVFQFPRSLLFVHHQTKNTRLNRVKPPFSAIEWVCPYSRFLRTFSPRDTGLKYRKAERWGRLTLITITAITILCLLMIRRTGGQVSCSPPNPAFHASFPTELPLLSMVRGLSAGLLKLDR